MKPSESASQIIEFAETLEPLDGFKFALRPFEKTMDIDGLEKEFWATPAGVELREPDTCGHGLDSLITNIFLIIPLPKFSLDRNQQPLVETIDFAFDVYEHLQGGYRCEVEEWFDQEILYSDQLFVSKFKVTDG